MLMLAKGVAARVPLILPNTANIGGTGITVQISKNGGAFGNPLVNEAPVPITNDQTTTLYYLDLAASDLDTPGPFAFQYEWHNVLYAFNDFYVLPDYKTIENTTPGPVHDPNVAILRLLRCLGFYGTQVIRNNVAGQVIVYDDAATTVLSEYQMDTNGSLDAITRIV